MSSTQNNYDLICRQSLRNSRNEAGASSKRGSIFVFIFSCLLCMPLFAQTAASNTPQPEAIKAKELLLNKMIIEQFLKNQDVKSTPIPIHALKDMSAFQDSTPQLRKLQEAYSRSAKKWSDILDNDREYRDFKAKNSNATLQNSRDLQDIFSRISRENRFFNEYRSESNRILMKANYETLKLYLADCQKKKIIIPLKFIPFNDLTEIYKNKKISTLANEIQKLKSDYPETDFMIENTDFFIDKRIKIPDFFANETDKVSLKINSENAINNEFIIEKYADNQLKESITVYTKTGTITSETNFRKGISERNIYVTGPFTVYYPNGNIKRTVVLLTGYKTGEMKAYYEDTRLQYTCTFKDDVLNGELKEYYPSGQLKREEMYEENDVVNQKCYHEDGSKTKCELPFYAEPQYKKGEHDLSNYLRSSVKYPENIPNGKDKEIVSVVFIIEKDGSVRDIKVTGKVHPDFITEAKRVVEATSGNWTPRIAEGKYVKSHHELRIYFYK